MAADSTGKSSCWSLLFSLSVCAWHNVQAPEIFIFICLFSVFLPNGSIVCVLLQEQIYSVTDDR